MIRASGNDTTEASVDMRSGYWSPDPYMGHSLDASPHGQNQISGPNAIAAETWAPTVASAHSSHSFMNAGIREQARLLDGIAALETRHGSLAPDNAAGPSNPTANATAATPGRRIKWAFCKRNFRALLQKYITRREEHLSSRYTTKKYMEEDIKWAAKVRDLKAHILALEARIRDQEVTMDNLSDECQAYREAITALQNKSRVDAQELQQRDHQISRLFDRFEGGLMVSQREISWPGDRLLNGPEVRL